jgi:hypothetical protein
MTRRSGVRRGSRARAAIDIIAALSYEPRRRYPYRCVRSPRLDHLASFPPLRAISRYLFLLRDSLLSCGPLLKNPFRPLEFPAPSRAEVLPAAIDEVLNHPDARPETPRRHFLSRHRPGNLGGRARERSWWRVRGICGDASHPLALLRSPFGRGRRHRSSTSFGIIASDLRTTA